MIPRKLAPLAVALASLALSGCVQRIMDFTVISTKNVDIPGTKGEKVTGEDIKSIVIVIPTGQPNIKAAVDDALNKGGGDVLLDGVISTKMWYIPYVYGQAGYVVEGTSLKTFAPGTAPVKRVREKAPVIAMAKAPAPAAPVDAPEAAEPGASATPAPSAAPEASETAAPAAESSAPEAGDAPAPAAAPAVHAARISASEVASELLP